MDNDLAVLRAAQLVEQDKVDVITGLVSGDEGLTVGDFMRGGKNIPVVSMYSASEDMTMREFYPYICVRLGRGGATDGCLRVLGCKGTRLQKIHDW